MVDFDSRATGKLIMIYSGPNYGTWKLIFEPTYFDGKYFSKKSQFHGKLASLSMQLLKEDDNLNWGCILVDTLIFSYLCLASVKCTHLIPRQGKGKKENERENSKFLTVFTYQTLRTVRDSLTVKYVVCTW